MIQQEDLVAHRGASAYAPEHTLAAYRLAIEQGADYVEQDLAVTKDGVLICLHDPSLERTTNVEQVFPDRAVRSPRRQDAQAWLANDFTLAEIKRSTPARGSTRSSLARRFRPSTKRSRSMKGKAGMFPELKTPEIYEGRDVDFEGLVAAALDKHGLRGAKADPKTPVILQTFGESSARKLARIKIGVPVVLLLGDGEGWGTGAQVKEWKGIVQGFGPAKAIVLSNPEIREVGPRRGHDGDAVHVPRGGHRRPVPAVGAEMEHFLYTLGVDALFTDNPDQLPEWRGVGRYDATVLRSEPDLTDRACPSSRGSPVSFVRLQ